MPAGPRIRANNVFGFTTDNPLTSGAASFNSSELALLPAVASAHAVITLDPLRHHGEPEIVVVTAHTAAATVATISRGQYGTVARAHPQGTMWTHAPIDEDVIEIVTSGTRPSDPYRGQSIFETDTNRFVARSTADAWQQNGLFFDPPACRVGRSTTQSLADATGVNVSFDIERYDTDNMFAIGAPTGFTIRTAGLYLFTFTGLIAVGTPDYVSTNLLLLLNASPVALNCLGAYANGSVDMYISLTATYKCAVNDFFQINIRQDNTSNTARNLLGNQNYSPEFAATWIGRGN